MMMLAVPAVAIEEAIDDVLRVRELVIDVNDRGELWTSRRGTARTGTRALLREPRQRDTRQ